MSDNELLLALSDMMDNKLKPLNEKMNKIEVDMNKGINKINIILENEIRLDVKLLVENYLPTATRYERALLESENIKTDIELLKKVVTEHSEKLQKIYRGITLVPGTMSKKIRTNYERAELLVLLAY